MIGDRKLLPPSFTFQNHTGTLPKYLTLISVNLIYLQHFVMCQHLYKKKI